MIPDYTDPTMCFVPSGYQSGYYYGGTLVNSFGGCIILLADLVVVIGGLNIESSVGIWLGVQLFDLYFGIMCFYRLIPFSGYDGSLNEWDDYSRYINPDTSVSDSAIN